LTAFCNNFIAEKKRSILLHSSYSSAKISSLSYEYEVKLYAYPTWFIPSPYNLWLGLYISWTDKFPGVTLAVLVLFILN